MLVSVLLGTNFKEMIMQEQLGIIDLGDAMTETRCNLSPGPWYDNLYGAGHWTC